MAMEGTLESIRSKSKGGISAPIKTYGVLERTVGMLKSAAGVIGKAAQFHIHKEG